MKKALLIIGVLLAAAGLLSAQQADTAPAGIEGKWIGQQQSPNGSQEVMLELKVSGDKGDKVTGTMTSSQTGTVEISDGKLKKDKVSFSTALNFNGFQANLNWSGGVKDGKLTLSVDLSAMSAGANMQLPPLVMKRAE